MIDPDGAASGGLTAAAEQHLRDLVDEIFEGRGRVLRVGPDGLLSDPMADDDERFPGLTRFRGLLESGAGHLAAARAAEAEQRRAAAVQARALAAFAAQRPAAVLDRPDDQVGAAAAGVAGRPAGGADSGQ